MPTYNYCCHNCASTNLKNEYISIDVLHTMRQTIEVWQKGCEALIGDLQCRIGVIEKKKFSEFHHLRPDIEKLKTQINSWEDEFYLFKDKLRIPDKKPHKCPVCEGKGNIRVEPKYSLSSDGMIAKDERHVAPIEHHCQPCKGKGIVWN